MLSSLCVAKPFVLFPHVKQSHMKDEPMKINKLKQRLQKDRPMTAVTLRMPEDVVEDLKRIAPLLGFSGYQPLMRAYIGQGLRVDLERLEGQESIATMVESLRKQGVDETVIASAMADAHLLPEAV